MRVMEETKAKKQKTKKRKLGKAKNTELIRSVLRLEKTINSIHKQITALSSDLSRLEADYQENLKQLLTSNEFFVSLADLFYILGDKFEDYLTVLLNFAEHASKIRSGEKTPEAYVYVKDSSSMIVYFDKESIPDELRDEVTIKKVLVW